MTVISKYWQQLLLVLSVWRWQLSEALASRRSEITPEGTPLPPAWLRARVGQIHPRFYLANGPKIYSALKAHVERHARFEDFQRVLDWGCGCGRVTRMVMADLEKSRVYGCDIDPDAIAWMLKTFPEQEFTVIHPAPPTPYRDGFFDFIYGISVFTHLDEPMQVQWLVELGRIVRPGGIIAVSVNSGVDERSEPDLYRKLNAAGFADRAGDREVLFAPFLQRGYYRLTLHSRDYILREWSRYFSILEYIPNGIGRQDLVIMRRSE